jgi:hypothetical protein
MLRFSWDDAKNEVNQSKHGICFEEARSVFSDENALEFEDPDHSEEESRFLLLGRSLRLRILVVCHCFRESESSIRIISVRRATTRESRVYDRGMKQ